jgi:hypothetical protein
MMIAFNRARIGPLPGRMAMARRDGISPASLSLYLKMEDGDMKVNRDSFFPDNFFIKDPKILRNLRLGIGVWLFSLSFVNFYSVSNSENLPTGRWSWISRGITAMFGPYGYPIFEALIGIAFIAWAFIAWSCRKS